MGLFDQEKKKIRTLVKKSTRRVAERAFAELVNLSPVWSGSYVRSHRIGIGRESTRGPTIMPEPFYVPSVSSAFAMSPVIDDIGHRMDAMLEVKRVDAAKAFTRIHISNDVKHAIDVEYLGTVHNPSGWHCYRLAEEIVRDEARSIIRKTERELGL